MRTRRATGLVEEGITDLLIPERDHTPIDRFIRCWVWKRERSIIQGIGRIGSCPRSWIRAEGLVVLDAVGCLLGCWRL